MANASAKRTAAQNETAIKNLTRGMLLIPLIAILLRFLLHSSLMPSRASSIVHVVTFLPVFILYRHLTNIGSPKYDSTTGALLGPGEDLNMQGVTEWCWDIIYVTWACQIGSAAIGEWFWWCYLIIPLFAVWKIYSVFLSPYLASRSTAHDQEGENSAQSVSRRQQKMKKRSERGDPRVKRL